MAWVFTVQGLLQCQGLQHCSTAGGGGGVMAILTAATAGVVTAMLYSGLGDKIHKLLGFKFCKFSPETA